MRLLGVDVHQCPEVREYLAAEQILFGNDELAVALDSSLAALGTLEGLHFVVDEVKYPPRCLLAALIILEVRIDKYLQALNKFFFLVEQCHLQMIEEIAFFE